jgi:hypothetical protein
MPKMTDVSAGAIFRLVGGEQFFAAANATYSKRGTRLDIIVAMVTPRYQSPTKLLSTTFKSKSRGIRCRTALRKIKAKQSYLKSILRLCVGLTTRKCSLEDTVVVCCAAIAKTLWLHAAAWWACGSFAAATLR